MDVMVEALGAAQAVSMMDELYSHVESVSSNVYMRVQDV